MLCRITHAQTQVTRALIYNKCTCLERRDSPFIAVIEILEGDEVAQQAVEIAVNELLPALLH
mgnify:CR=1 FL=1